MLTTLHWQVLRLGNVVPDFEAETTQGPMKWHEWIDGSWAVSPGPILMTTYFEHQCADLSGVGIWRGWAVLACRKCLCPYCYQPFPNLLQIKVSTWCNSDLWCSIC